jgi:hypothetical protein
VAAVVAAAGRGKLIMADIGNRNAKLPEPAPDPVVPDEAGVAPFRAMADDAAFFEFAQLLESRLQENPMLAGVEAPASEAQQPAARTAMGSGKTDPVGQVAFPSLSQKVRVSWAGVSQTPAVKLATAERPPMPPASPTVAGDDSRTVPESREPTEELTAYDLNRLERFGTRKANARWTRNLTTMGIGAAALAAVWAALPDTAMKAPPENVPPPALVSGGNAADSARMVRVVPLVPGAPGRDGAAEPARAAAPPDALQPVGSTSLAALPDLPAVPVSTPGEEAASPTPAAKPNAPMAAPLPGEQAALPANPPLSSVQPPVAAVPAAVKPSSEKPAHLARPPKAANPDGTIKHARATPAKPAARQTSGRVPGDDNGQATNSGVDSGTAGTRPPGLVTGQKTNADKGFDPFFIPKFIGRLFTDR